MVMKVYKNLPNFITGLRILGTAALLFVESLSLPYFIIYVLAGITDVLDGMIARLTKTTSALGSLLDSIADLFFYTVLLVKILPKLIEVLPTAIWFCVATVILIRIVSYSLAFVKYKRLASVHTYMNKMTGGAIFVYPFLLMTAAAIPAAFCVCAIAGIASVEELLLHVLNKDYSADVRTILFRR
jgi:CDP-diacylglycerol--glycerol-3-phosphate 3-phosphatidyltransferase